MKISRSHLLPIAFVSAAALAIATATIVVDAIESRTSQEVHRALTLDGQDWVAIEADGLVLRLTGMAETEALRFRALSIAGSLVDTARLIDAMEVRPAAELRAPDFSVELLRNDDGISLIGLIPAAEDREAVVTRVSDLAGDGHVSDMLELADYPMPEGWEASLEFGLDALARLPRSKISITPRRVAITAITASADEKARLETEIARAAPDGVQLALRLSAPRPVITPFTLRFLIDAAGARFDACSADTETSRTRILAAAVAAGAAGRSTCTIGLGVPSPRWSEAVEAGIAALAELGAGSLTFSDADISLIAADSVSQRDFDHVVGELESALPEVFSLTPVLTEKPDNSDVGPPEFTATLSPEGQVQLRGRLTDDRVRSVVESFAAARFGSGAVYNAARLDAELPEGWPVRVLAALEALALLTNGTALVQPEFLRISGSTGAPDANAEIARILAAKLGEGAQYEISVRYVEALDPAAGLPTPEECVAAVNAILAERKITFAPGSADIEGDALETMDRIAAALKDCADVPMEIAAHSDSQGREEMNLNLSQARADSVLNALLARRVLTSNLTAVGYGEVNPIADNETEEGREANRRIEFTLITGDEGAMQPEAPDDPGDAASGGDAPAEEVAEEVAEEAGQEAAEEAGDGNEQN